MQDLEIDAAFAVGHLKGDRLKNLVLRLESWLLRRFSGIVTISGQMRKCLIDKGVEANRIGLVRNWVDLAKITPLAEPNLFRAELGLRGADFVVLYAGNIGAKQALDVMLGVARQLASIAHVVIAGDGPEKPRLVQRCANLPNVHFLPLQGFANSSIWQICMCCRNRALPPISSCPRSLAECWRAAKPC